MLQRWLSVGIHTITQEMSEAFAKSSNSEEALKDYIDRFGHRGPGEMDLCQKRWVEREISSNKSTIEMNTSTISEEIVHKDIESMGRSSVRKPKTSSSNCAIRSTCPASI